MTWLETGAQLMLALIALISGALVWCESYEDGLFGRAALGVMGLASLAMIPLIRERAPLEHMLPAASVFVAGVAVFMLRHAFRYWQFTRCGQMRRSADRGVVKT